jgi:hypothetical protein
VGGALSAWERTHLQGDGLARHRQTSEQLAPHSDEEHERDAGEQYNGRDPHTGHRPATTEERGRLPSVQAEAHTRSPRRLSSPRNRTDAACSRGAVGETQRSYESPSRDRHSCSWSSTPRSSASASVRTSSSAERMRSRSSIVSATTSASSASDLSRNERVGSSTSLMSSRTSSSGIRSPARYTRTQIPRERASPNRRGSRLANDERDFALGKTGLWNGSQSLALV